MSSASPKYQYPRKLAARKRDYDALKLLEALRMGVVPPEGSNLRHFTVGRQSELALFEADLRVAREHGAARVFLGDYGTGKTHLLECLELEALSQGFLTARVVLDSQRIPPSQPKRVYRELVRSLRYPEGEERNGLEPLLRAFLKKPSKNFLKPRDPAYHAYFSPVCQALRSLETAALDETRRDELTQELLDWIEGHPTQSSADLELKLRKEVRCPLRLYALKDYRPWAHLYSYLVGGIAYMAKAAGYQGLLVLFDEAEFYAILSSAGREFADLLFGYYAAAALGPERVQFDLKRAKRGGQAVHRSFAPGYVHPLPLYCAFAMTEDPLGVRVLRSIVGEDLMHRLTPLQLADYQELSARVVEVYKRAYPDFTAAETVQYPMGQVIFRGVENGRLSNPRQVLKFIMEMLDISRLRRELVPEYVKLVVSAVSS